MKKYVTTNVAKTNKVSLLSKHQAQQLTGGGVIIHDVAVPDAHTHAGNSQDIIAVLRRGIIAV